MPVVGARCIGSVPSEGESLGRHVRSPLRPYRRAESVCGSRGTPTFVTGVKPPRVPDRAGFGEAMTLLDALRGRGWPEPGGERVVKPP